MKPPQNRRASAAFLFASLLLALGLVLTSCQGTFGPAATSAPQTPVSQALWPHEQSDLAPDPAVLFKRLPNGFGYAILKNARPKDRVAMQLIVNAGSLDETDDQRGLAHFLEHLVFDGSTHFKPNEMVTYFQKLGMSFGPDANAQTGFTQTVYMILLPKGNQADLDGGLLALGDIAMGALLLPSEIDRERDVVLAEMRRRDSAGYRTYVKTLEFLYPDTRAVARFPIGVEKVLKQADQSRIKAFYDTWYRPDNMVLVVVGDTDPAMVEAAVAKTFGDFQPRAPQAPRPGQGRFEHQGIGVFYHHEPEQGKTRVSIDLARDMDPEPDTRAFRRNEVLEDMAMIALQHRFDALLEKPDTPLSTASARHWRFLQRFDTLEVTAGCDPDQWPAVLTILETTLRQALDFGFDPDEIERIKKEYLASLDSAVKQAPTRDSEALVRELVLFLNLDRVFQSPAQDLEELGPTVRAASVDQVNEALRRLWSPKERLVLVTGNAEIEGAEETIRAAYEQSARTAVAAPERLKKAAFPYLPGPKENGSILKKEEIEDLGIVTVDFVNGVRLNLKPTKFKADEVLAQLSFGRGRSDEPADAPGLALLAEQTINQSGLGKLNRDELDRALSGKNTAVRFAVREDRCLFDGESVSGETELLFQLLYTYTIDPGFREEALRLSLKRYEQGYAQMTKTIDGVLQIEGLRFLAGGDTRFGLPSSEDLKRLSLDTIKTWIEGPLKTGPLELSVVGDIDVDRVIDLAARYFGSLPVRGPAAPAVDRPRPRVPQGKFLDLTVPTRLDKALVVIGYPTAGFRNIERTRRLSLLAEVVSDRMRVVVREKLGLAYSPFAFSRPSRAFPDYGLMLALVHTAPADTGRVAEVIQGIAADLAEKGVTEDENMRALKPMLTAIREQVEKNEYWLGSVLTGLKDHPEQLDWSRSLLGDYASISPAELSALAKKYLDNARSAVIILKPTGPKEKP